MSDGFNRRRIIADVHSILGGPVSRDLIVVLASYAAEILSTDDEAAIAELSDALSAEVLARHRSSTTVESVLAMVRTYSLKHKMSQPRGPGAAPRRAYDVSSPPPENL